MVRSTPPWSTGSCAKWLKINAPTGILVLLSGVVGAVLTSRRHGVGTLLLGGKTRDELFAPQPEADVAVASRSAAPRIHVVRLPEPVEAPLATH